MKKTIISIILVLVLTISLVFILAACNNGGKTDTPTNTQTTNTGDNGSTNNNNGGTTNNGGGDNNGGDSGGQQSGNNNSGTPSTSTITLNTAQQIATAVGTTFKVTATNLSGQTPTTAASDGTYFYVDDPYARFLKKYSENNYQYYAQQANNKYIKMYSTFFADGAEVSVLSAGNLAVLFLYAGQTITYQNVETTTFLSRPVKKYTYVSTNANNPAQTYTEEIIIDDATGACLKHDSNYSPVDSFTNGTSKLSAQVSEFTYGASNATAVATFLQPFIDKIDVNEWDTAFLATIGLDDLAAPSTADNIYTSYWWSATNMRNSDYPDWFVRYDIHSASQALLQDTMEAYLQSVYNAGAKLDDTGAVDTFANLFYDSSNNDDGSIICLDAYVEGHTDYYVEVECRYFSNVENPYWRVNFEVHRVEP